MATFQEVAKQCAEQIREAIRLDGFAGRDRVTLSELRGSRLVGALKTVRSSVEGRVYTKTRLPLSSEDKGEIYSLIGERLGLARPAFLSEMTRAASNDELVGLVNYIEDLLKGTQR